MEAHKHFLPLESHKYFYLGEAWEQLWPWGHFRIQETSGQSLPLSLFQSCLILIILLTLIIGKLDSRFGG